MFPMEYMENAVFIKLFYRKTRVLYISVTMEITEGRQKRRESSTTHQFKRTLAGILAIIFTQTSKTMDFQFCLPS